MNIDALNKIKDVMTFSQLLDIFHEWLNSENPEEYNDLYSIGYAQLICYPAIVLTKDFSFKELEAAHKCYEICQNHVSESMKKLAQSGDDKAKLALDMEAIPPEKRLLAGCNEFFLLHYLLNAVSQNPNIKDISEIDGDDFAKQWNYIFKKGYRGDNSKKNLDYDFAHLNESAIIIKKMHLSNDVKETMETELIKNKFSEYYNSNRGRMGSGNGCLIFFMIAIVSRILISCINNTLHGN